MYKAASSKQWSSSIALQVTSSSANLCWTPARHTMQHVSGALVRNRIHCCRTAGCLQHRIYHYLHTIHHYCMALARQSLPSGRKQHMVQSNFRERHACKKRVAYHYIRPQTDTDCMQSTFREIRRAWLTTQCRCRPHHIGISGGHGPSSLNRKDTTTEDHCASTLIGSSVQNSPLLDP